MRSFLVNSSILAPSDNLENEAARPGGRTVLRTIRLQTYPVHRCMQNLGLTDYGRSISRSKELLSAAAEARRAGVDGRRAAAAAMERLRDWRAVPRNPGMMGHRADEAVGRRRGRVALPEGNRHRRGGHRPRRGGRREVLRLAGLAEDRRAVEERAVAAGLRRALLLDLGTDRSRGRRAA